MVVPVFAELHSRDTWALPQNNLQIVLNTKKTPEENPYLNQATQKSIRNCQIWTIPLGIFLPKKIVESKPSNPKYFDHPYHLKFGVLPLGC